MPIASFSGSFPGKTQLLDGSWMKVLVIKHGLARKYFMGIEKSQ
jgi:hypothetical protein